MKEKKSILGRGLDELLEGRRKELFTQVSLNEIESSNIQPRKFFDKEKIEQLSASIKESGVIQPILVRRLENGRYSIVAGERRWQAAKQAGLQFIPAIVRDFSDQEALKIAIIENIQREDLNILEEAEAYKRLIDEYGYTQEKISEEIGKSRSHVANTIRLLSLPEEVKEFLVKGQISPGHARTLINNENALELAQEIVDHKLNVRDVERKRNFEKKKEIQSDDVTSIERRIAGKVKAQVTVTQKKELTQVLLSFKDHWALEDFIENL